MNPPGNNAFCPLISQNIATTIQKSSDRQGHSTAQDQRLAVPVQGTSDGSRGGRCSRCQAAHVNNEHHQRHIDICAHATVESAAGPVIAATATAARKYRARRKLCCD